MTGRFLVVLERSAVAVYSTTTASRGMNEMSGFGNRRAFAFSRNSVFATRIDATIDWSFDPSSGNRLERLFHEFIAEGAKWSGQVNFVACGLLGQ